MEFQAVILAAGNGSRMTDLTATTPKALLPIANKPMIWYPVRLLERAGFPEALVITHRSTQSIIQKSLEEICGVKMQLDFVSIPDNEDWGTADTLRHIKDRVKRDLLLLSCDLITDVSLHLVADIHRTFEATLTMLLSPLSDMSDCSVPGGKANKKIERDIIGLDEKKSRVLFMGSEADFEENVSFKKSVLKQHPFIELTSRLLDGHLYIMKKWVLDYLCDEKSLSTIKGELIPNLIRKQFSKPGGGSDEACKNPDDIYSYIKEDEYSQMSREYSSWVDDSADLQDGGKQQNKIRCCAYTMDPGGLCLRANTLLTYCEANRQVPKHLPALAEDSDIAAVHPTTKIPQKASVGGDSLMGAYTTVGEKVVVKRSVVGSHCNIHEKVKITNSVVMDHVLVDEGASLNGCVVCPNAHIGEKCDIKDCIVGASQHINTLGKFTNEILVGRDQMMEID